MKHITCTCMLSAALAASLAAQNENDTVYELAPVVVTGDLWESELQKTTASVSVLDQAVLDRNGVQHFEDVVDSIPNLTWTGGTSRPRYIQIRGIGENSQFEGETPDSAVRFLVDDFDLTGLGTVGSLFDVQQVEVLRGPQAGAFGANAAGGVIKIVSNEPSSYWTGQAEATIGNDNLREMGVAVGGPILEDDPEQLTFRFSINSLNRDGFRENQFLDKDDTNERDELTSRLKLRWLPNELWSFEGGLLYADADNGYDEFTLTNERTDTFSDQPGRDEQETRGISLRATYYGINKVDLTYVGQITDSDSLYSYDSDWADPTTDGNYDGFLSTGRERDVYSQEFRFDSVDQEDALGWIDRWTAGAFVHNLEELTDVLYTEFDSVSASYDSKYTSDSFALFGQASHDISDNTRLILGLRAEHYDIDVSSRGLYYGNPVGGDSSQSDTLWGGKVTAEHDLSANNMVFVSAAKGYKAGGANIASFNAGPNDPLTYEDEDLYNFETGIRSRLFHGSVEASLTAFYLRRENAQFRDSQGAGGFFRYLTVNGDGADHFGAEAEATWFLTNELSASGSLGLLATNHDEYSYVSEDTDNGGPITNRVDSGEISNSPSYNYSLRVDYEQEKGFFTNVELVGRDSYYESNSHDEQRDAFAIVNASIGYKWDNWIFTIWSKNLFDEDYAERVFFFGNRYDTSTADPFDFESDKRYEAPAAPRTFGVTANYRW